jgi:hypothetical protein
MDQGVEVLHIGGANGDFPNVGVKTSAPNKDFTVNGEISASNTIWTSNGNSNNWNSVYSTYNANSANYTTINYVNNNFLPLSGGTVTGNVGIGTDPSTKLHIQGSSGELLRITDGTRSIYAGCDINQPWIGTQTDHGLRLVTNSSEKMHITSSGKVGINTNTPSTLLDVASSSNGINPTWQGGTNFIMLFANNTNFSEQAIAFRETETNVGAKIGVKNTANGAYDIIFANRLNSSSTSSMTERMRITHSGNVGIGTASPSEKLTVSGNISATGSITANTLQASVKNFVIKHPIDDSKSLQYSSLESPYIGVRLTGEDKIINGDCVVYLPDYIKGLIHEEDVHILLTNYKHSNIIYVDYIDIENNMFVVKSENCIEGKEYKFFWSLTGVRKDVPNLQVEI